MRITVEIDAKELRLIQQATGQKKKSPAVSKALSDYLRMQQKRVFIGRALRGETNYSLTNDQLEARDVYEAH